MAPRRPRIPRAKGPVAVLFALIGLGGLGAWLERSGWVYAWFPGLLPPPLTSGEPHRLLKVRDGDTVEVRYHDLRLAVRLRGVDTAESAHVDASRNSAAGEAATAFARSQLTDAFVRIEFEDRSGMIMTDQYGRALGYLWIVRPDGEELFNESLIRSGHSRYETSYGVATRHHARLAAAEEDARAARRGVWLH